MIQSIQPKLRNMDLKYDAQGDLRRCKWNLLAPFCVLFVTVCDFFLPILNLLVHIYNLIVIERSSTLMDAKIDTLWARYNKNDQSDRFHFLKLSFFHRVEDPYSFWTHSGISKGMFILVFLIHTGEKPYKCQLSHNFHSFYMNYYMNFYMNIGEIGGNIIKMQNNTKICLLIINLFENKRLDVQRLIL